MEPYGGGIWATWFDRDLGVAGRVLVRREGGALRHELVRVDRPVLRVPSLAIHLNREVNSEGFKVNVQNHLVRLLRRSSNGLTQTSARALTVTPYAPRSRPSWLRQSRQSC